MTSFMPRKPRRGYDYGKSGHLAAEDLGVRYHEAGVVISQMFGKNGSRLTNSIHCVIITSINKKTPIATE